MNTFEYELIALFVIIWLIAYPLLLFVPWYRWWNKYDPKREYNCLSLANLAYYKYNYFLYLLSNTFTTGPKHFEENWWNLFIGSLMTGQAKGIVEGGVLTPKTLCGSLIPDSPPLPYLPNGLGRQWPSAGDTGTWKKLILAWAGASKIPTGPEEWKPDISKWNSDSTNFLAQDWGIPPTSPVVLGYLTGQSSWGGVPLYKDALANLFGISAGGSVEKSGGGWYGFLKNGKWGSVDEANRAIWSEDVPPKGKQIINHQKKCNTSAIASSAIGQGVAFGVMGGMAAAPETAGISILIGAIGGLIVGGLTGAIGGGCL